MTELSVEGDRARLGRVLDNLVDNAAKYSDAASPVMVSVSQEARWAVLRVRDFGIGVSATDLPHIFELYYRARNVGRAPGEGLGLAGARQLVVLHGGTLEVESREGIGSTFTMRLPSV